MKNNDQQPKNPVGAPQQMDGGRRVNLYLDAYTLKNASQIGDGNMSLGIRTAIAMYLHISKL